MSQREGTAKVSGVSAVGAMGRVTLLMRTYFSIHHIRSAARFTREARAIETEYDASKYHDELFAEHRGRVTAAILMSVAFLEGSINELFTVATDSTPETLKEFDPETRGLMADMWRHGVPRTARFKVTEKFDIALSLARKAPFDRVDALYKDVKSLVALRNALIHYEPEWVAGSSPNQSAKPHEFEKRLKGKFALNPVTGAGNPFWPDKCLGYGCAGWAVESSVRFADGFFSRMGLAAPYDHLRKALAVK